MYVERIGGLDFADSLHDAWNQLAGDTPFCRREWLGAWWRNYGVEGEEYLLAIRHADGRLAGVAPWYRHSTSGFGRVVSFLGSGETCSDYLTVLGAEEDRTQMTTALAEWLIDASGQGDDIGWDMLQLDGVAANDPTMKQLLGCLEHYGCEVHTRSEQNTWRIPLPATWDDYRNQLSKPNRRHVRVLQERYVEPGLIQVHVAQTADDLDKAWSVLVDLHQRRRHELGQPGCFASPRFARFARQAAENFLQHDALELLWIEHDGAPLAAQLAFLGPGATYAYQVGIESAKRDLSPGWLVHTESIKRAIAQGRTAFDLLRGDEEYKHRLGAKPHPLCTVRVVPPRLGPMVMHTAWVTGGAIKSWIKTGLHKTGLR